MNSKLRKNLRILEPESGDELQRIISDLNQEFNDKTSYRIRVSGLNITPNEAETIIDTTTENLENLKENHSNNPGSPSSEVQTPKNFEPLTVEIKMGKLVKVIHVNETIGRVTVEPGIKIENLVELLKPHKMTLHNLTSFSGKTVGELTQMGCHGSGISLPPFDQAIRGMKIITASGEEIVLENGDERLKYAKCSLGTFGIVKELTLKCVPTYFLRETIRVLNYEEIFQGHAEWLHKFKHVKYHHIPTTGHAVVFTYEDLSYHQAMCANRRQSVPFVNGVVDKERRAKQQLLRLCHRHFGGNAIENFDNFEEKHSSKTAAKLKLWLLDVRCEDNEKFDHIKEINLAELDYWRCKKGSKIDVSDKILMKDITEGQQGCRLSREFAFPIHYDLTDLEFIVDVLEIILRHRIPVTAAIEQMWSSSSSAPLSPVYAADDATGQYHTWVSINFVSREIDENTKEIFDRYYSLIVNELGSKYDLSESLSTLQPVKGTESHFENLSNKIKKRIQGFEKERKSVDPEGIFYPESVKRLVGVSKN